MEKVSVLENIVLNAYTPIDIIGGIIIDVLEVIAKLQDAKLREVSGESIHEEIREAKELGLRRYKKNNTSAC